MMFLTRTLLASPSSSVSGSVEFVVDDVLFRDMTRATGTTIAITIRIMMITMRASIVELQGRHLQKPDRC